MSSRLVLSLVVLVATAACDDNRDRPSITAPMAPTSGTVAFLDVSNPNAPAGALVTVTATARQAQSLAKVGAFAARLSFDAAGLTYVGESVLPGMRAVNPKGGEIIAAGASSEGFADGRLFAVTFRVVNPAALTSLTLAITELNGTDFGNHLTALDVRSQLYSSRR